MSIKNALKKQEQTAKGKTETATPPPAKLQQKKVFTDRPVKDIETCAEGYHALIMKRLELQQKEAEAKELLIRAMKKHKRQSYVTDRIEVYISEIEKVKVKRPSDADE